MITAESNYPSFDRNGYGKGRIAVLREKFARIAQEEHRARFETWLASDAGQSQQAERERVRRQLAAVPNSFEVPFSLTEYMKQNPPDWNHG